MRTLFEVCCRIGRAIGRMSLNINRLICLTALTFTGVVSPKVG